MKKIVIKVLLGCLIISVCFILDYKASTYGDGFYFQEYPLKYGMNLEFVNTLWITSPTGEGYIVTDDSFSTIDKRQFFIEGIVGYLKEDNILVIKFMDKAKGETCFLFSDEQSVDEHNPKVLDARECSTYNKKGWVYLSDKMHPFFYYWKLIGFFFILFSGVLFILAVISLIKLIILACTGRRSKSESKG